MAAKAAQQQQNLQESPKNRGQRSEIRDQHQDKFALSDL